MYVNEEGLLRELPLNVKASVLAGDQPVVGDVLVLTEQETREAYGEEADHALDGAVGFIGDHLVALERACRATLQFHAGGEWGHEQQMRWEQLTGQQEATTKALCDFIREALFALESAGLSQVAPAAAPAPLVEVAGPGDVARELATRRIR